jgi:anti-anti-sigma factor
VWRLRLGHQHHLVEEGLAIAGEIDIATVGQLRDRLIAALAHRPTRFGLDLSGVTFADSQLIHVLLQARAMIPGGRLVVSGCRPQVARLLGVCGLAGLIAPRHDACAPEAPTEDPPAVRSFAA